MIAVGRCCSRWGGAAVLASRWPPLAMAATHLGTLGFLGAVMLGALYQMIPVSRARPCLRYASRTPFTRCSLSASSRW